MIRRLYITPVNRCFLIKNKRGWKEDVICLMFRWADTVALRCVNWYVFLLNLLGQQYNAKYIGLYRYDELSTFKNCSGPQMGKIKKHLQKIFKNNGLDVIIKCNMEVVNYLDVTLNLNHSTYRPFQKLDNIIQNVHVESNHPPNIIKQIPKTIGKTPLPALLQWRNIQWINTLLWRQTTPVWLPTKVKVQPC